MHSMYVDRVRMARLILSGGDEKKEGESEWNTVHPNEIKFRFITMMVMEKVGETVEDIQVRMMEHVCIPLPTGHPVPWTHYPAPWAHLPIIYPHVFQSRLELQQQFIDPGSTELQSLTHAEVALRFTECLHRVPFQLSSREEILFSNVITQNDTILTPYVDRQLATEQLQHSPVGTWLIRESSVRSGNYVQARVISVTMPGPSDPVVVVHHYLIAHIEGFGFVWMNTVEPELRQHGFQNPGVSSLPFFIKKHAVFPRFLALLAFIKTVLTGNQLQYDLFCPST